MSIAVFYAYYEKDDMYRDNIRFFFRHAVYADPCIDYYIVVNGACTLEILQQDNVKVLHRENRGFDFGGWAHGLAHIPEGKQYDYYAFLNSSCRGPFMPPYCRMRWYQPFVELLQGDVKLVGPTINALTTDLRKAHVQTYMFMMTQDAFEYVVTEKGLFKREYNNMLDVIRNQEIGLSELITQRGWNLSALVPEYQNRDYRCLTAPFNPAANAKQGDIVFPGNYCFGREVHPYEIIFMKTNRGVSAAAVGSLTGAFANRG